MTDKFKVLRDAANRSTRVNADVALLCEAALAAVAEVEALRKAAQAVVDRWDSPQWKWAKQGPTADVINDLRAALSAKEESRG